MSWIVSKGRVAVSLSLIEAETSFKSHVLSPFKRNTINIPSFTIVDFENGLCETERSNSLGNSVKTSDFRFSLINGNLNNNSYRVRWPLSLAPSAFKVKNFVKIKAVIVWKCESRCELTDVPASLNDKKNPARLFDTISDILRSLSLAQSLLKVWNAPICRIGNRRLKRWKFFIFWHFSKVFFHPFRRIRWLKWSGCLSGRFDKKSLEKKSKQKKGEIFADLASSCAGCFWHS